MTTLLQTLGQTIGNWLFARTEAEPLAQEYNMGENVFLEQKLKDQHDKDDLKSTIELSQVSGPTDIENGTSVPPASQQLDSSLKERSQKREAFGKANIKDLALIKNLKAEKDSLYAMMTEQQSAFREKESKLLKALEDMKLLNQQLQEKYDSVRKKADYLQQELDEILDHCDTLAGTDDLIKELRDDRQTQETPEHNKSFESRERQLLNALDTIKASCEEISDMYNSEVSSAKQKSERLERKLLNEIQKHQDTKSQLVTLSNQWELSIAQQNIYIKKIAELEEELSAKRKADVFSKQQVERLHEDFNKEIQNHCETRASTQRAVENLRVERDALKKTACRTSFEEPKGPENQQKKPLRYTRTNHQTYVVLTPRMAAMSDAQNTVYKQRIARLEKEIQVQYETDVLPAKQQVERLQEDLDKEIQAHSESRESTQQVIENLTAEIDALKKTACRKSFEEAKGPENQQKKPLRDTRTNHQTYVVLTPGMAATSDAQNSVYKQRIAHLEDEAKEQYETDVLPAKQQVERLQEDLHKEIQSHSETRESTQQIIENLTAEIDALKRKACRKSFEKPKEPENRQKKPLRDTRTNHQTYVVLTPGMAATSDAQNTVYKQRIAHLEDEAKEQYETDVLPAKQQVERLQKKLDHEIQSHSDTKEKNNKLIKELKADTEKLQKKKRHKWFF